MSVFDSEPNKVINAVAGELKNIPAIEVPAWAVAVKTGSAKERIPDDEEFWFKRCASILRSLYVKGNNGVRRLRQKYGSAKVHKVSRSHHKQAGGKGIRLALQQLEQAGLVKKEKVGRSITNIGKALVDKASK